MGVDTGSSPVSSLSFRDELLAILIQNNEKLDIQIFCCCPILLLFLL